MADIKHEVGTEWIFCRDIDGRCSGLNPKTQVLEKKQKTITVQGKQIQGWMVKIVQEQGEGHVKVNYCDFTSE